MANLLKGPLIIAVIVVVARVVMERAGFEDRITNYVSAAALTCLIGPLYFAWEVSRDRHPHPYRMQIAATAMYAVLVRAMILPVYWMAYYYQWPQGRFAGPTPESGPLIGYIGVPLVTAAFWIVVSTLAGAAIGAPLIALRRRA